MATAPSQGPAIAAAIRHCQAMAAAPTDCGARFKTTRGGWVVAKLCGDYKIIVAAETREDAELAARNREADLKRLHAPDLPPCRRIVTIGPGGAEAAVTMPSVAPRAASANLKCAGAALFRGKHIRH